MTLNKLKANLKSPQAKDKGLFASNYLNYKDLVY